METYSEYDRYRVGDKVRYCEDPPELDGVIRDIFEFQGSVMAEVHCYCCGENSYFCLLHDLKGIQ